MFWISLAITYLTECPLNARYYEFTVGMSVVSVTVCSISNILSDFRLNMARGELLSSNGLPLKLNGIYFKAKRSAGLGRAE